MTKRQHTPPTSSTKRIRIGTAYYPPIGHAYQNREVPYIRLSGTWLVDAGFAPGDTVVIHVSPGRLVLTRA